MKILIMNDRNFKTLIRAAILALFIVVLFIPRTSYAGTDNGVGNGGLNNGNAYGHDKDNGNNGNNGDDQGDDGNDSSVPVNGGIVFLVVAGVAYTAKKFYDLKRQQLAVA